MKIFTLTSILLIFLTGIICAQNDPILETDTVSIPPMVIGPGQEFSIKVDLWNDEELGAVTLPFHYPTDKLDYIEVVFAGHRIDYISTKPVTVDETAGTILIGGVVIFEEFIQPGLGTICEIRFKAADDLVPDEIITIDTGFIAPASNLLLSNSTGTVNFTPAFVAGQLTVGAENRQPYFTPIPDVYIAEGDSLYIDVEVTDPDGDSLVIVNPIHPYNSEFTDNGDGTGVFAWAPDFIGPLSADLSPFYFVFWATDGDASSYIRVRVNIINVNRAPEINAPTIVEAEAGDSLGIHISTFDPDFESTVWDVSGLPSGASFDGENPGLISWASEFADSGQYQITLIATDPYGLADTAFIDIELFPVTLFSLRIDTLTSFSGRTVDIDVFLKNKLNISNFSLLLRIDPSVLTVQSISNAGGRCEHFDDFNYTTSENGVTGLIRINSDAGAADPIFEGEGSLFTLTIQISPDLNFVGQQVPMSFHHLFSHDNILILDNGTTVYQSEINTFNGYILIGGSGDRFTGDVNLNGIAYEISDAVYLSNFYINPVAYPLNEQQVINSDVNFDGFAPSIADLVVLIAIITGEMDPLGLSTKPATSAAEADIELIRNENGLFVSFDSPVDIGGAVVRFTGDDVDLLNPTNLTEMDLSTDIHKDISTCLLISYEGKSISASAPEVIKLSDDANLSVELFDVELADTYGAIIETRKTGSGSLPESFELFQNYPNPFNPTTEIEFNLSVSAHVSLTVFNILGQEVIRLADKEYPAGQHSVTWNSEDRFGNAVASGIYLYRIKAGDISASRKMVLLK